MTIRENKSQYAVLGMLSFGLKSGYEIGKGIKNSTAFFWAESDGQIYPILKKLCRQKFATVVEEKKPGKRAKKNYTITHEGKKALLNWIARTPTTYHYRNEFLLQLFFGRYVSKKKIIAKIQLYRESAQQQLTLFNTFKKMIHEKSKKPFFSILVLNFGRQSLKTEISWCDDTIKLLENNHG